MKVLLAIGIVALLVNSVLPLYVDTFFYDTGNLIEEQVWVDIEVPVEEEEVIPVVGLEVNVPAQKIHDVAPYDYYALIEMFWENRSSGEFYRYAIEVNGQWLETIPGIRSILDGYGEYQDAVLFRTQLDTFFTITVEESGAETITVDGELRGDRKTYKELVSGQIIQTDVEVNLTVSGIPALGGDLPTDIYYNALLKTYPDPWEEQDPPLGERVYKRNSDLDVGDNGSIVVFNSENIWLSQVYNWSIDRGAMVSGYEALEINITQPSLLGGFLPFREEVWICNNVSVPVKDWTTINSSFSSENETFWFVIENKRRMLDNAFQEGDVVINWGDGNKNFNTVHKIAVFEPWKSNYMPMSGEMSETSFHMSTEEAVEFAIANSVDSGNETIKNLREWLDLYDPSRTGTGRVTMVNADYEVSEVIPLKTDTHYWNLSLGYAPTDEELDAVYEELDETGNRNATWAYRISVGRNVTWNNILQTYTYDDPFLIYERLYNWSAGYYEASDLPDEMVTLQSSEDILRSYPGLEERLNLRQDKIVWGEDDYYGYNTVALEESDPWTVLMNTLTGIEIPSVRMSWTFQHSNVFESGQSVSGTIDTTTGRMVHYMVSEGTTLGLLFQ